jgi:hypothetical protein
MGTAVPLVCIMLKGAVERSSANALKRKSNGAGSQ